MKIKDVLGKTAYVVGGSSGIGLAVSKLFAEKGANVLILSRNSERLKTSVAEIRDVTSSESQKIEFRRLDASRNDETLEVMKEAVSSFGVPQILVNCVGKAHPGYFEKISFSQFEDIIKTNLYSVWNTVSAIVPFMKKAGGGYIVNTSSFEAFFPLFGYTDYTASKAGVIGFSEVLRMELKPDGISVSVLLPSDTETPGFEVENSTKPYETQVLSEWGTIKPPDHVARMLWKGMRKGQFFIIPNFAERIFYVAKRLFPWLVAPVLDGDVKKARRKMEKGDTG